MNSQNSKLTAPQNPLHSANWLSESTFAAAAYRSGRSNESPSPSESPAPPEKPRLRIYRDGKNVTGKTTTAYSGEKVVLNGVVLPKKAMAINWTWTVPAVTVKQFHVSNDHKHGEKIEYAPADWKKQKISVHWVDGSKKGLEKVVQVTVTVNDKALTASTTIKVRRPDLLIQFKEKVPPGNIAWDAEKNWWKADMEVQFSRQKLPFGGQTQWVQLGKISRRVLWTNGTDIISYSPPLENGKFVMGLDNCLYPYDATANIMDIPAAFFVAQQVDKSFVHESTMWLMWLSPNGGEWVPLSKVDWSWSGTLQSTGQPNGQGQKPVWKAVVPPNKNPDSKHTAPAFTTIYPEWNACLDG